VVCNPRGPQPHAWLLVVALLGCNAPATEHRVEGTHAALQQPLPSAFTIGAADLSPGESTVVARASWGSGAGELGKRDEGARPGPMSLVAADDGSLYILDQVNRRVVRFQDGQVQAELPIAAETTEDIAVEDGSLWTLVYEPGAAPGYRVERYLLRGGPPVLQHALDRSFQLATGLFVTGGDVWVEMEHDVQRRVISQNAVDRQGPPRLGRLDRAGRGFRLSALRSGRYEARVHRVVHGEGAYPLLRVTTPLPLVGIHALETDAAGRVFLGLLMGEEGKAHRSVVLVADGSGYQVVELFTEQVTDAFRPLAVGSDGSIYQLSTSEEGVTVRRWATGVGGGQ
jgi:hypothetical protein